MKNRNSRPDVDLFQAKSIENPFFPKDYYEEKRKTMDPRRFNALFNGAWEVMEGLVYKCFDEEVHYTPRIDLPQGTVYYAGVDWGTTAPAVIVVRAITPNGKHYQVHEFYKTGQTITDMVQVAKQIQLAYGVKTFYADPSQPGYISEFCRAGIHCAPAINDIKVGIDAHYELIASGNYYVFRGDNKNTVDEYASYHYPEPEDDAGPDKDIKDRAPVKQNDHAMDANRYCTVMTAKKIKDPIVAPEYRDKVRLTILDHMDQVRQRPHVGNYEEW
jgi:phage terminase large subunit